MKKIHQYMYMWVFTSIPLYHTYTLTYCILQQFVTRMEVSWVLQVWCFGWGYFHGLCWGIWREKAGRIFDGVRKYPLEVVDSILFEVASWVTASKDFHGYTLNGLVRDWPLCFFSCMLFYYV